MTERRPRKENDREQKREQEYRTCHECGAECTGWEVGDPPVQKMGLCKDCIYEWHRRCEEANMKPATCDLCGGETTMPDFIESDGTICHGCAAEIAAEKGIGAAGT